MRVYPTPSEIIPPNLRGVEHSLFFVEHSSPDSVSPETKSRTNLFEAGYALKVASYLVRRGYDANDITLLTLYVGQMFAIKRVSKLLQGDKSTRGHRLCSHQNESCV